MSSPTAVGSKCNNFQPHRLRPDKCRSCFGDAKQHANGSGAMNVRESENSDATAATNQLREKRDSSASEHQEADCSSCKKCQEKEEEVGRLRREIEEWQARCRAAEQANQKARDELRLLESEMEEMHDNFKEEESEQFEQVKQELDAALKNCKILQIRLNKSERQYSQLEQVKVMLEKQLEASQQEEQRLGASANDSSESQNQKRAGVASGSDQLTGQLYEMGQDFIKVPTSEYDRLLRDLNDISERERDLQEQIKYSQEEAQVKGDRLQAVEAENEILLGRINKLTQTNSSLRSSLMSSSSSLSSSAANLGTASGKERIASNSASGREQNEKVRDLCEQNEQLKLALEVLQSECERVKARNGELQQTIQMKEQTVLELSTKLSRLEEQAEAQHEAVSGQEASPLARGRLELECRQLRARVAHGERECRQLRSQLEMMTSTRSGPATSTSGRRFASGATRSQSMESASELGAGCQSAKCRESLAQLEKQCRSLAERNQQLETKLQRFIEFSNQDLDQKTSMESELFAKLRRQLETSESELAKAKSRLVELDIECGRAQRQHKRLLNSLESCGPNGAGEMPSLRRNKLPEDEASRDAMSRQELRQAMRELELDIEDLIGVVRAKECLLKEQQASGPNKKAFEETGSAPQDGSGTSEQQLRSLRRLLDQEQLLSNNLKLDVANLERDNVELATRRQMLERERLAMEEELDKLRQLSGEFRAELEESERDKQMALGKARELSETVERLRLELNEVRHQSSPQQRQGDSSGPRPASPDALLMARNLSEIKVKNGFLMRQLEMARDDSTRQLEEARNSAEAQLRRAVELAQLELKERHLQETQQLREELNDCKQKLAALQRQTARQEEEANLERDRARAVERDWRRDKSQWQRAREQLEGQLAIERRSSEFRLKEAEAAIRDKERQLINMQDRCVQLERDLKRLQNKFQLLEEDSESKVKQLARDLEMRNKELSELNGQKEARDEQQFDMLKRLQAEKATLKETLDRLGRSYDEKLVEARQLKELLHSRQEQSYKERSQQFERIEALTRRLNEMSEHESQTKLLKQRLEILERQLESHRRDLVQLREERARLKTRCDELEKRELITKTSSISGSSAGSSFFKPFSSPRVHLIGSSRSTNPATSESSSSPKRASSPVSAALQQQDEKVAGATAADEQQSMVEKLSGKINDQRNLMNILRQQLNETQMELKQLKLLQSSEKSKWQTRLALLTGRLNECEEKLAYETLMLSKSPALIDQLARPQLEMSWTQERKANLELIQQQQQQIEMLARDLKKTSQAYDLLRLQSKQLETHNNKLSKKLIEYQQQTSIFNIQDRELEQSYDKLLQRNAQLAQQTRPLLDIVAKIIASLDAPEQQQQPQQQQARSGSTDRPLRAPGSLAARAERALDSDDSVFEREFGPVPPPAHQVAASSASSRLTRLLAGGSKQAASASEQDAQNRTTSAKKTVKRVRVKCSTLGITTGEKKQLKQQLRALDEALAPTRAELDRVSSRYQKRSFSTHTDSIRFKISNDNLRPSVEPHNSNLQAARSGSVSANEPQSPRTSATDCDQSSQQSSHTSRVHWQVDSDLESECSFSLGADQPTQRQDLYRRFPQASRAAGGGARGQSVGPAGVSLTDYESESSLASDYSPGLAFSSARRAGAPSGAESDSGLTGISFSTTSNRKSLKSSAGFRGRLTSTLRNISRSITGGLGASDTEESSSYQHQRRQETDAESETRKKRPNLKEIRV